MESVIAIKELCEALGVEYDTSKSSAYYLHMVKEYRFHYEAAQQSVRADEVHAERTMSLSCPACHRLIEIVLLASLRRW